MCSRDRTRVRVLDDLGWWLAPDGLEAQAEPVLGQGPEAQTWREWIYGGRAFLGLSHAPGSPREIVRLTVVVPASREHSLADLIDPRDDEAIRISAAQRYPGDRRLLVWQAAKTEAGASEAMDALVGRAFARFLVTGRPLRRYSCTFMLPLDLRLDDELEISCQDLPWLEIDESEGVERYRLKTPATLLREIGEHRVVPPEDKAHAQAYEFFETQLQEQLFERLPEPDASDAAAAGPCAKPTAHYRLRRDVIAGWRLELVDQEPNDVKSAQVDDVSLFRYYNGLVLLSLRVSLPDPPDSKAYGDDSDWWRALVDADAAHWETITSRQAEHWLRFTKTARLLFESFYEQAKERKTARICLCDAAADSKIAERRLHEKFSPIVIDLLRRFLPRLPLSALTRSQRLRQVVDDRQFVHVAYGLAGPAPRTSTLDMEEFERVFSYALYVDQRTDGFAAADGWAYDKAFTRRLFDADCQRRWQGISYLAGFTNASSVFMGFGWYFDNVVARTHVPYIYARIQILALFFHATLELFDRRIGAATRVLSTTGHHQRPFRKLRADFIEFTNIYWFRHPTPQVQGEEIAKKMMEKQDLDGVYALLKDEMERADEYASAELSHWYQDKADGAGRVALGLAVFALVLTAADIWFDGAKALGFVLFWVIAGLVLMLASRQSKDRKSD